jgi:hypothetical protein
MEWIFQVISDLFAVYGVAVLFKAIEVGIHLFGG